MKCIRCLFLFAIPWCVAAAETPSWEAAREARRLLGPEVWARVLRIENINPHSVYPETVYATVFEYGGILWFYTGQDGTQSFSLHRGRIAAEKASLPRLLRAIDPGFVRHTVMPELAVEYMKGRSRLPEGCFVESVAALHESLERGMPVRRAALLTYYLRYRGQVRGHTVLVYETDREAFLVDWSRGRTPRVLRADPEDAVAVAREAQGDLLADAIVQARWIPVVQPIRGATPVYVDTKDRSETTTVAG